MAVRPFHFTADVEGNTNLKTGGPKRKDGRMEIFIKQRDKGGITDAFRISSYPRPSDDGKLYLVTSVFSKGKKISEFVTEY